MTYWDEFKMRQASIYELRNYARSVGILSPTTLKKDEIIDKILKLESNEIQPEIPKNRKGRPPKHSSIFNDFNSIKDKLEYDNNRLLNLRSDFILSSQKLEYDEEVETFGYFAGCENNYGVLIEKLQSITLKNIIYIPISKVNEFKFKLGDLIHCNVKKSVNHKIFTSLIDINGQSNPQNRADFDSLKIIENNKRIGNSSVLMGTRNIILSKNLKGTYDSLIKKFDDKESYVINLCVDALPENISNFSNIENFENFYSTFDDSHDQIDFVIKLAVLRAKRLCELGKDVILVVNELKKTVKYQNFSLNYSSEDVKYRSLSYCYSVLALARNFEKGSVTVFAILKYAENDNFTKILIDEFENLGCNFINEF